MHLHVLPFCNCKGIQGNDDDDVIHTTLYASYPIPSDPTAFTFATDAVPWREWIYGDH